MRPLVRRASSQKTNRCLVWFSPPHSRSAAHATRRILSVPPRVFFAASPGLFFDLLAFSPLDLLDEDLPPEDLLPKNWTKDRPNHSAPNS